MRLERFSQCCSVRLQADRPPVRLKPDTTYYGIVKSAVAAGSHFGSILARDQVNGGGFDDRRDGRAFRETQLVARRPRDQRAQREPTVDGHAHHAALWLNGRHAARQLIPRAHLAARRGFERHVLGADAGEDRSRRRQAVCATRICDAPTRTVARPLERFDDVAAARPSRRRPTPRRPNRSAD